ncbi:phytanoyl-CoA dioxygenase PhyH [Novosphingobium taihuense]|nr:phytanoyl-CoA dioxygenase family protein [Novosphingobium taihuense]TWH81943.1 phytanoyl-CoA dioxygenase PhyH [Novosphingobium taihuense]
MTSIEEALKRIPNDHPGIRLREIAALPELIGAQSQIGQTAQRAIGPQAMPVRAILFDKSSNTNWSLGWHQDRTICVDQRIETPGYGPWTIKQGIQHVSPPIKLLESMVTMRIHLDDVPASNAPLLIAPGSHRMGRIAECDVAETVKRCGTVACIADAGDVWLYSTPILHASEAAAVPSRRRVLQIDYAAAKLPNGLNWAGV